MAVCAPRGKQWRLAEADASLHQPIELASRSRRRLDVAYPWPCLSTKPPQNHRDCHVQGMADYGAVYGTMNRRLFPQRALDGTNQ